MNPTDGVLATGFRKPVTKVGRPQGSIDIVGVMKGDIVCDVLQCRVDKMRCRTEEDFVEAIHYIEVAYRLCYDVVCRQIIENKGSNAFKIVHDGIRNQMKEEGWIAPDQVKIKCNYFKYFV